MPPKSKKITIRFSKQMKLALQQAVVNSNFGLHGKSKWLADAINKFVQTPYLNQLIENGLSESQAELTEIEAFYLTVEVQDKIKSAIKKIHEINPYFEGVQSAIVRAAVVYNLMF